MTHSQLVAKNIWDTSTPAERKAIMVEAGFQSQFNATIYRCWRFIPPYVRDAIGRCLARVVVL